MNGMILSVTLRVMLNVENIKSLCKEKSEDIWIKKGYFDILLTALCADATNGTWSGADREVPKRTNEESCK